MAGGCLGMISSPIRWKSTIDPMILAEIPTDCPQPAPHRATLRQARRVVIFATRCSPRPLRNMTRVVLKCAKMWPWDSTICGFHEEITQSFGKMWIYIYTATGEQKPEKLEVWKKRGSTRVTEIDHVSKNWRGRTSQPVETSARVNYWKWRFHL